jgi:hypothetical protein
VSSILYDQNGNVAYSADGNPFPFQGNHARNAGIDPNTGAPAPITGPINKGVQVRASAHGDRGRAVVGGDNKAGWDATYPIDDGSHFNSATSLPRAQGPVGTATRAGGAPVLPHDLRPDDLITLPDGTQTQVQVAERLGYIQRTAEGYRNAGETAPVMPNPAETQAAQEAEAKATHEAAEAAMRERVELNTHPHPAIEEAHMSFARDVPTQDAINLLVKAHRGVQPTLADVNRVAESMGVSASVAADRLRALNTGIEGQFGAIARGHGVDPDKAADWMRQRRQSETLTALRDHVLTRNVRAWEPLIAAYKAAGGQ